MKEVKTRKIKRKKAREKWDRVLLRNKGKLIELDKYTKDKINNKSKLRKERNKIPKSNCKKKNWVQNTSMFLNECSLSRICSITIHRYGNGTVSHHQELVCFHTHIFVCKCWILPHFSCWSWLRSSVCPRISVNPAAPNLCATMGIPTHGFLYLTPWPVGLCHALPASETRLYIHPRLCVAIIQVKVCHLFQSQPLLKATQGPACVLNLEVWSLRTSQPEVNFSGAYV